jgi:RNA 3'-terminal phosphate cyclase
LEPLVQLAPFAKRPLQITLRGITNDETDIGVRAHPHRHLHAHVQERERETGIAVRTLTDAHGHT